MYFSFKGEGDIEDVGGDKKGEEGLREKGEGGEGS
jgi:hypothetical protein